MASAAVQEQKCYCGRPLRHNGRHIGYKPVVKTDSVSKPPKMVAMLEAEIAACHDAIRRWKGEISVKQNALLDEEVKLKPLLALLDVYQNKRIAGPVIAQASTRLAVVENAPRPVERPDDPDATEEDFEPIEADYNTIKKWAAVRSLKFDNWDDLRSVNIRREQFELPPFKKKL